MTDKKRYQPSLAQLFEPPDDYIGLFGWVLGYSADTHFLNDAAERFSRQTQIQRSYLGKVSLAIILDPGNAQISIVDVPGVLHLLAKSSIRPFNLMHAKVGLLAYQHKSQVGSWLLRLIVSTGNWTRETVEESLDVAWWTDLYSAEFAKNVGESRQICADILAAWEFIRWLRTLFDCRAIELTSDVGLHASREFESLLSLLQAQRGLPTPRFFDNREQSLLSQLPGIIRKFGSGTARNKLFMGSGFFEMPTDHRSPPAALVKIVESLRIEELVTVKADVDIFVNPKACQSVAHAARAIQERGWSIRPPSQPESFGNPNRFLHAKFIFSANFRRNSNSCNNAWVYLGSGNLTRAGFLQRASSSGGNLEAGVVLAPENLLWSYEKGASWDQIVSELLPIQTQHTFHNLEEELETGGDLPDRQVVLIAAPVAFLVWSKKDGTSEGGWLSSPSVRTSDYAVVGPTGEVCLCEGNDVWWPGSAPRQVPVLWKADGHQRTAIVPVIDEFGRFAGSALSSLEIEEAWAQLVDFPLPPDEDELPQDEVDPSHLLTPRANGQSEGIRSGYAIRQIMKLVEIIAAKQTAIESVDWAAWCARLEQTLVRSKDMAALGKFRTLGINPLSPLWHPAFRPIFAEDASSREGEIYEETLKKIETTWNVSSLRRLGV